MRWPWWLRWWRGPNGSAAQARADAEAALRAAQRATPRIEALAHRLDDLTDEEFVRRVAAAFRRRPT